MMRTHLWHTSTGDRTHYLLAHITTLVLYYPVYSKTMHKSDNLLHYRDLCFAIYGHLGNVRVHLTH